MQVIKDISYGAECLDLYLPEQDCFDLFVYFHGGGLTRGSKERNSQVFVQLANSGVAVASAEYRKMPEAAYPDFIEDAAQAVAWIKSHIGEYGNCKRIFVGGSSAGGYLSMMLCFDARWLGKHGLTPMDIDGFLHDAGQPTKHYKVLSAMGLDSRRVIVDETAPLYYVGLAEAYPPMQFIVSDQDMENRLEQTQLMLSTLKHFGHQASLRLCHGKHVAYVKEVREDGSCPFAEMILEFIQTV